jgi:type IV pilus assembly protein PilA
MIGNRLKQLGQGMTEYIIIVALIAIAAIAVYGFFGDAIRGQVGAMTQELAGQDGNLSTVQGAAGSAGAEQDQRGLGTYTGN